MLDDGGDSTAAGILGVLGTPTRWLLQAVRAALDTGDWSGDAPDWGLALIVSAVLLRMLTLPLWAGALRGRRYYAVCVPLVSAVRRRHSGDREARVRALRAVYPNFRVLNRAAETGVALVAVHSCACLLWAAHLGALPFPGSRELANPYGQSIWTLGSAGGDRWRVLAAVAVTAAGWYVERRAEARRVLTYRMPEWVWTWHFGGRGSLGHTVLPLLWAVLVLPVGTLLSLFVWQLSGQLPKALIARRALPVRAPAALWAAYVSRPTVPPQREEAASEKREPFQAAPFAPDQVAPALDSSVWHSPKHAPLYDTDPKYIGEYRLLGRLGKGGMGTVYLAHREGSATHVALKAVHTSLARDTDLLRRFVREAEVLTMVDGAFTARMLGAGTYREQPYIVMELLDGLSLDTYVKEHGPIHNPHALRTLGMAVAAALSALHERELVHRDVKPSNIMLTSAGPKLVDFGIVRTLAGSQTPLTVQGHVMGTPAYMAPERFDGGQVTGAADVWSWACSVLYAATGVGPFDAPDVASVMHAIFERGPDPRPLARLRAIEDNLADTVALALSRRVPPRPANGWELLSTLCPGVTDHRSLASHVQAVWSTLRTGVPRG